MVVLNGNKNQKVIAYKGDREPVKVFYRPKGALAPVLQENVSYKPKTSDTQGDLITYSSEYKKNLLNLSIKGGTSQAITPTPNEPQPIENASNVSVELSGANIFDIDTVLGNMSNVTQTSNGIWVIGNIGLVYRKILFTNETKKQGKLTLRVRQKTRVNAPNGNYLSYLITYTDGTTYTLIGKGINEFKDYIYTTNDNKTVDTIRFSYFGNATTDIESIMINWGEPLPYQPYTEPTTVTTDLTLAESDVLNVDYINKKATVTRNTKSLVLTGKEENWQENPYNGYFAYSLNLNLPSWEFPDLEKSYYCTHFKGYTEQSGVPFFEIYKNDGNYLLDFYFVSQTDLAEWQSWLEEQYDNGTPVKVQWSIDEEYSLDTEENVTGVWVNELLNLPTIKGINVISTDAEIPTSNLKVTFAKWGGDNGEENL